MDQYILETALLAKDTRECLEHSRNTVFVLYSQVNGP